MKKTVFLTIFSAFLLIPFISKAAVVINEVLYDPSSSTDTGKEYIRLYNNGDSAVDLTGYNLNAVSGDYFAIPSFSLSQKSFVTVHWRKDGTNTQTDLYTGTAGFDDYNMGNTTGWVALFNGNHAEENTITDYLEYGAAKQTHEPKAVAAGIWTEKDFIADVEAGYAIKLKTDGIDNNSSNDWMSAAPSITQEESSSSQQQSTTQQISANNQPPIADAGDDVVTFIDDEITFDGSKSYDPDGFDLAYEWNLGEGGVENDVAVTHKYSYPGTYLVSLTVFDGRYYVKDTITIEIYPKKITINEFLPSPEGKDEEEEWIELYNDSDQIADISGWQLDDEDGGSKPFVFPKNTLIAPQSYLVFSRKTTGIALNNDKDKIRLLLSGGVVFQEINYEKAPQGQSSAKIGDKFFWATPTPGIANVIGIAETPKEEQTIQTFSTTTNPPEQNISINYKKDENQIPLQTNNQKQNLIANLGNTTKNADYKLIIIAVAITIIAFAAGATIIKFKNRLKK